MIEQIQINDWRQFDNLTIDFDKRLTILTGANGSGKTTILNILSKAFGESVKFVSNVSETADGSIDYTSSVIGDLEEKRDSNYKSSVIGNITYNSTTSSILVPEQVSTTYNIDLKDNTSVFLITASLSFSACAFSFWISSTHSLISCKSCSNKFLCSVNSSTSCSRTFFL